MSLPEISDDAKAVMGAWFGTTMQTTVNLHLIESRPTARTQAALQELVKNGYLATAPFGERGTKLTPLTDGQPYLRWLQRNSAKAQFDLTEEIPR